MNESGLWRRRAKGCGCTAESRCSFADIPRLTRPAYANALLKYAASGKQCNKLKASERDASYWRVSELVDRLPTPLERLRFMCAYVGLRAAADLLEIIASVRSGAQMCCRLWQFWQRDAFRVCFVARAVGLMFLYLHKFQKRVELGTQILLQRCCTLQHVELVTEKAVVLGKVRRGFLIAILRFSLCRKIGPFLCCSTLSKI